MKATALLLLSLATAFSAETNNITIQHGQAGPGGQVVYKTSLGNVHIIGLPQPQAVVLIEAGKMQARPDKNEAELEPAKREKIKLNQKVVADAYDANALDQYNQVNNRVHFLEEGIDNDKESLKKLKAKSPELFKARVVSTGKSYNGNAVWNYTGPGGEVAKKRQRGI